MRTYEVVFIADPRLSDEEVVALTDDYKQMYSSRSLTVTKEESWGRRKLAYPINKLTEGKYVLICLSGADTKGALHEVEHRMRQSDKVLRYLTVRTDEDLKRAARVTPRKPSESEREGGRDGGGRFDRGDRGDRGDRYDRGDRFDRGDSGRED